MPQAIGLFATALALATTTLWAAAGMTFVWAIAAGGAIALAVALLALRIGAIGPGGAGLGRAGPAMADALLSAPPRLAAAARVLAGGAGYLRPDGAFEHWRKPQGDAVSSAAAIEVFAATPGALVVAEQADSLLGHVFFERRGQSGGGR